MASIGSRPPSTKAAAEAVAACQGLTRSSGSMFSSASRCAPRASRAVSSSATCRAVTGLSPRAWYSSVSSSSSASGIASSSAFSLAIRACSLSRWLLTDTYSPSAIETAPPTRPAAPAVSTGARAGVAPATPTAIAATDTIPSLAPSTPARKPLRRFASPLAWGSSAWLMPSASAVGVGGVGTASVTDPVKQDEPAAATKGWLSSAADAGRRVHPKPQPAGQLLLRLHPDGGPRGSARLVQAVRRPAGRRGERQVVAGGVPGVAVPATGFQRVPELGPSLVPLQVDAECPVG